jgi:hypothetical protein
MHNNAQNQEQASWKDDPFELKGSFKGIMNVNHKRNLEEYAYDLVSEYGKYDYDSCELNLSNVPNEEQNELTRLYIEATGRDVSDCVHGTDTSIENEYTCALLAMLKDDSTITRRHFAEVTRKNIIAYYAAVLQEELDRQCNNFMHSLHNELDMHSYQDPENGDIMWGKF